MHFESSISLGNIISIVTFVFTLYGFHIKNTERIIRMETKVDLMWLTLRRQLGILRDSEDEH